MEPTQHIHTSVLLMMLINVLYDLIKPHTIKANIINSLDLTQYYKYSDQNNTI